MVKYLYNGAELPGLPAETLPYAAITQNSAIDYDYSLFFAPVKPSYGSRWVDDGVSFGFNESYSGIHYAANSGDTEWMLIRDGLPCIAENDYGKPIWANTDIYSYSDGTLYLAASDPVPVSVPKWAHMNSFLKGLALGLAGKPLEFAPGKEPVAYLYNGVRLPKLPESDLPYAVVVYRITNSYDFVYRLYLVDSKPYAEQGDSNLHIKCIGNGIHYDSRKDSSTGEWGAWTYGGEDEWLESESMSLGVDSTGYKLIWSNTDLEFADGTVYLATSDPVPVYE